MWWVITVVNTEVTAWICFCNCQVSFERLSVNFHLSSIVQKYGFLVLTFISKIAFVLVHVAAQQAFVNSPKLNYSDDGELELRVAKEVKAYVYSLKV